MALTGAKKRARTRQRLLARGESPSRLTHLLDPNIYVAMLRKRRKRTLEHHKRVVDNFHRKITNLREENRDLEEEVKYLLEKTPVSQTKWIEVYKDRRPAPRSYREEYEFERNRNKYALEDLRIQAERAGDLPRGASRLVGSLLY